MCGLWSVAWEWLSWVILAQRSLLRLQSRSLLGLLSSEGLAGAGGSVSRGLTHLAVAEGFCGNPQLLPRGPLSIWLLEWPHDVAFGFPQNKWGEGGGKRERDRERERGRKRRKGGKTKEWKKERTWSQKSLPPYSVIRTKSLGPAHTQREGN